MEDIKHSQTHMTFARAGIFQSWGENIEPNVESLLMILFPASFTSLSPPYSGSLTSML